ncbi:DUF4397 domain-containing protein [Pedobacter arcticus]|uniref:DUF4397 domain-containing protein n=1 Tax=Pedobacter arcticus TaxID=752140 RepID=UPI0002DDD88A|nr:DUF4397 domain-containing protein [Pedobacter arcticus]
MFKSIQSVSFVLLSFFALAFLLNGCEPVGEELQVGEANLRIINAAPEANEYSFFINDSLKTGQPLKFGEGSAYLKVSAGTNGVYTKLNDAIIPNTKISLFLQQETNYTLFLAGLASKDSLIYLSTLDNNKILSDTMATVRFINVAPDAKALNLVFQENLVDSVNVISGVNYRSSSVYIKIKPSNYFLRIKKTGGAEALANLDNYKLEAGKIYTFWAKGLISGSGAYALALKVLQDN